MGGQNLPNPNTNPSQPLQAPAFLAIDVWCGEVRQKTASKGVVKI